MSGANCALITIFFYCCWTVGHAVFLGHWNKKNYLIDWNACISISFCFSRGLLPADADYNLLDVARRLEMYGMILYPAKVRDSSEMLNILDLNWMERKWGEEKIILS